MLSHPLAGCAWTPGGNRERGFAIYKNIQATEIGLQYFAKGAGAPVAGVVRISEEDRDQFWTWNPGSETGFVRLPNTPHAGNLLATIYSVTLESDHPELKDATIKVNWSLYDRLPWGIYNITKTRHYYIDAMGPGPWGYGMDLIAAQVEGFRLNIELPFYNVIGTDYAKQNVPMSNC